MGHVVRRQPAVGDRYGRLLVVALATAGRGGKSRVDVECVCGNSKCVYAAALIGKRPVMSCGCLAAELTSRRSRTHGLTHSREWAAWHRIKIRCRSREDYIKKGVVVCPRWAASFEAFLEDMGPIPADKPTIDRLDNSKGYEPGNCRWATMTEQNRNKSNNTFLTFGGRTMTVAEWSREVGMSHSGLADRLKYMTTEEALTLPDQRGQRKWRNAA